jgi:glycerol-3-phosphate dehydrogenase (NAD(P)+)
MPGPNIAVIGGGNFGTSLAWLLGNKYASSVTLWAYEPEVVRGINENHENPKYLTGVQLPTSIVATNDIGIALSGKHFALSVVPSKNMHEVWAEGAKHLHHETILICCSKGIDVETLMFPDEILAHRCPDHLEENRVYLSGPSFARQIAEHVPTGVTIAGTSDTTMQRAQDLLRTDRFLTFRHGDVRGVEVAGAVKNVIAIGAGASVGLGFPENTMALVITRGFYEMIKIGMALGGRRRTFAGLPGTGDLWLTATSTNSRNFTLGKRVGGGENIADVIANMDDQVAEGYMTSKALHSIIRRHGINAPICEAVYMMLHEGLSPQEATDRLCAMELGEELSAMF